ASLRRIAHFDYWSEHVRPSMLAGSNGDLLAFGKGQATIVAIARRFAAGQSVTALRDLRGVAYLLGAREALPVWPGETLALPSLEDVTRDPMAFARMTRTFHHETNPFNAKRLTQAHGDRTLVLNPPCLPIGEAEMDAIYDLPYTRRPHPRYAAQTPARGRGRMQAPLVHPPDDLQAARDEPRPDDRADAPRPRRPRREARPHRLGHPHGPRQPRRRVRRRAGDPSRRRPFKSGARASVRPCSRADEDAEPPRGRDVREKAPPRERTNGKGAIPRAILDRDHPRASRVAKDV